MKQQESGMTVDVNLRLIDLHTAIMYLQNELDRTADVAKNTGKADALPGIMAGSLALDILHHSVDDALTHEDGLKVICKSVVSLTAQGRAVPNEKGGRADD